MFAVLAVDALEHKLVEEYDNKNLKQVSYGKTDISEFSQPRTIVLWSSFMTGVNKEAEVLARGGKDMWNVKFSLKHTVFSEFKNPFILDLPGFNYDTAVHEKSRTLLKKFFETDDAEEKKKIRSQYNKAAFDHHRKIKQEFLSALEGDYDLVLGYFSLADAIGHLNFGNKTMMKLIYEDFDELAGTTRDNADKTLVLSDHGMKPVGVFGDHSDYGFWSTSWRTNMKNPKITDFRNILVGVNWLLLMLPVSSL